MKRNKESICVSKKNICDIGVNMFENNKISLQGDLQNQLKIARKE